MNAFRICKYDPALRMPNGAFTGDDWTSVSDIGLRFGGQVLTATQYMAAEDKLVQVTLDMLAAAGIEELRVADLENHGFTGDAGLPFETEANALAASVVDGMTLAGPQLSVAMRAVLRELFWCTLVGPQDTYVHFGHDFYLYAGGAGVARPAVPRIGIFIEDFVSPYNGEEE